MPDETIPVLRFEINDGVNFRPIFVGALEASTLERISEVPSFGEDDAQYEIAEHVLSPPIERWQRPPLTEKVNAIANRFSKPGEFMPNPVLLAVHRQDIVDVEPHIVNGQATGLYAIKIRFTGTGDKPLWVLDGQHRLKGIAASERPENQVPFVLLHSENQGVPYTPEIFAKIFAEVSTEATALKELHREWLQYAFRLGKYDEFAPGEDGIDAAHQRDAMEATARLCREQTFNNGNIANPFFNSIQFNPEKPPTPAFGHGFAMTAAQLKGLIHAEYYKQPFSNGEQRLSPSDIAREIALAIQALIQNVSTPTQNSVFSGNGSKRQQPMEEGFICGVLARLYKHPDTDWNSLLVNLRFPVTDWEFGWVVTTGGNHGGVSKKIAKNVFVDAFEQGSIPHGSHDFVTYLQGDRASVHFTASHLSQSGNAAPGDKLTSSFDMGGITVFSTGGRPHLKLRKPGPFTSNIGKIKIVDPASPFGEEFSFAKLKRGIVLSENVTLKVLAETYGGRSKELEITIKPEIDGN